MRDWSWTYLVCFVLCQRTVDLDMSFSLCTAMCFGFVATTCQTLQTAKLRQSFSMPYFTQQSWCDENRKGVQGKVVLPQQIKQFHADDYTVSLTLSTKCNILELLKYRFEGHAGKTRWMKLNLWQASAAVTELSYQCVETNQRTNTPFCAHCEFVGKQDTAAHTQLFTLQGGQKAAWHECWAFNMLTTCAHALDT